MTDAESPQCAHDVGFGAPAERRRVLEVLGHAELTGSSVGIVHLDVDGFHRVNARFGQAVGNEVLAVLRNRLTDEVGAGGIVVAADGDAFVSVLPAVDAEGTRAAAARLLDVVRRPIPVGDHVVTVHASAGTAWRAVGDQPIDLVEDAFLACRQAKATAPGTVVGYEGALGAEAERRQRVEDELRRAIAFDELVLHVQPEIRSDGAVIGVEALVRWQHPTAGLLPPAAFLPEAEATGLMVGIGEWVLDRAIALASRWRTLRAGAPLRVWVNLAAQQLERGEHLAERMRRAVSDGVIDPACIGFEVTESSLLEDLPAAVEALRSLRALGFEIALDDFGTGYSSLTYLRQLPVSTVKIDRQFVAGIGDGSLADEAIVEAVIDLSTALGLKVVAEGVEDAAQAERLIALGADSLQGFHFSRPHPPEVLEPILTQRWCGVASPMRGGGDAVPAVAVQSPAGSARSRLFFSVLDAATDSVVVTAHGTRGPLEQPIVYVNDAFRSETGFDPADVLGRSVGDLFATPDDPALRAFFGGLCAEHARPVIEAVGCRADGSAFLVEITVSPVLDQRGFHTHWLHVRRNLSLRRAAEGERARLQALMDRTDALVYVAEAGGPWLYANEALRRALGVPVDVPVEALTSRAVLPPELRPLIDGTIIPALRQGGAWTGELRFRHATTGELVDIDAEAQLLDDPLRPGTRVHAIVGRDITTTKRLLREHERRRALDGFAARFARSALNERPAEFFDHLAGRLHDLAELLDADVVYFDTIDRGAGVLRPLDVWRGAPIPAEPDREVPLASVSAWLERIARVDIDLDENAPTGEPTPWRDELAATFPGTPIGRKLRTSLRVDGELLGVLGLATSPARPPWTDDEVASVRAVADTVVNQMVRRRAERAFHARDEWYVRLLGELQDLLIVLDHEGVIRYANPAVELYFGHFRDLVIGGHFLDFVHPDDRALAAERFSASVLNGNQLDVTEVRVMRADGSSVWCDVASTGRYDRVIGGFTVALRDVSEQRAAADAAQRGIDIDQFVASLARWASEVRGDDFVDGLTVHLEGLARLLGADHAFTATIDGDRIRNVAGWTADGDPAAFALPTDSAVVPAIVERYRTLQPLVVDDILEHDEPWAREWRSFPVPDRAGLNVPLVAEGRCFGSIGIAMMLSPRRWNAQELDAVSRAAHIVANLLARQQVEASLRLSEERMRALLDSSEDILTVVDDAQTITYGNQAFVRALGYSMDEIVGMRVEQIIHPDDCAEALRRLALLNSGTAVSATTLRLVAKDGSADHWEVTSGRMRDRLAGGRVYTCRNVSVRAAAERRSATWIEMLRSAFDLAQSALDLDSREFVERLPAACAQVGAQLGGTLVYIDRVDVPARRLVNVAGWGSDADQQKLPQGDSLDFDALPAWIERLCDPEPVVIDGDEREHPAYVHQKAAVLGGGHPEIAVSMTAAGELFGVLGACRERGNPFTADEVAYVRLIGETIAHVLERARLDDALRASESLFRLLSENAADVVMLVAWDGTITYASPSAKDLLGHSAAELTGKDVSSLAHPDGVEQYGLLHERVLTSGRSSGEVRLVRADGGEVWVDTSTSAVTDPDTGRVSEYRISMRDVSDRKRLEQRLEWQALHDPLTGLANRILLRRRLDLAAARRVRPNDVTVLLVDLDRFKEVNDTHGHAFGDDVLRALASRFESLTRPTDTLARTGGDEFVLLCPETDATGGVALARRVVDAACAPIDVGGVTVTVGASVGVAHQSGDLDASALLVDADRAMYEAKRSGSGEVRVAALRVVR